MTQSHQQFELLSIEQVASLLSVSTKTVRRLIEREQLHFHRVGRVIRVSREDLRAYLNVMRC
jgi:excisionase family DNA binding protein